MEQIGGYGPWVLIYGLLLLLLSNLELTHGFGSSSSRIEGPEGGALQRDEGVHGEGSRGRRGQDVVLFRDQPP